MKSYPIETIIAEKFHALFQRNLKNSRSKDYYDLYLIKTYLWHYVRENVLREALEKTFKSRETEFSIDKIKKLTVEIKDIPLQLKRWSSYIKKSEAKCTLVETMDSALWILEKIKD